MQLKHLIKIQENLLIQMHVVRVDLKIFGALQSSSLKLNFVFEIRLSLITQSLDSVLVSQKSTLPLRYSDQT